MAGGNMGALDFSLGIRDNFSKPLEQLEKKLNEVSSYANKDLLSSIKGSYEKSAEDIKKSINKLQYAWDDVDAAVAKVTEKHPFADTSSFDKVRDKIKDIATEFMSIVQTTNKFDMDWSKKLTGFFKSADVDFQMHQITALSKAAQNEVNASTKTEEEYWKREQKAIDRATASYANIGKEFMSLSKIKAGLLNQEFASPKDEATTMAAVKSLDQYIEVMKKAKQQYVDLADQGRAQESILDKGGAALGQVFSSEYWTTKNGAVETMRMALTNWKALTQEQKEEKRQALAAIDAIVANAKTAANASKGIEQQEKRNEQAFVTEQKQIDRTIERYRELTQIVRSAMEQIVSYRSRGLDYSSLLGKLQPVQAMRHDLRNAIGGEGYSFNLYDRGEARNQIKDLQDLTKQYDDTLSNLIANRDKVRNITSLIEAMQKRWADIQANPNFKNATLPSGIYGNMAALTGLGISLNSLSDSALSKRGSVSNLLSEKNFGTIRREVNAVFSEIEKGYRKSDKAADEHKDRTQRNIEYAKRNYARLFDQLNALRNARANANILGIDTKELDAAINHILLRLKTLREFIPGMKGWNPKSQIAYLSNYDLGTSAYSKREEELVNRLIAKYQELNSEKRKSNADVLARETSAARDLASAFDRVHNSASKSSQVLSDIKSLFFQGGIVFGAQQLFNELVHTGGEIMQQHIALQTIVGDLQDANQLFGQIQDLALRSPFTFGELNRDVKQLAAFGVETDQLYDKTRRLADISSGLGVSFERLGLAYGQVKARSWLDGKELRQFAYAGLPMLQKLADYYSKTRGGAFTTSQVRDMITKRQVSFEDVDAIFDELTNKGGQFYNMQDKLSQTLLGRYMKLKDAWDIMLSGFADGQSLTGKFFSFVLDRVTDLIQSFNKLGPVIAAAFSGYAAKRLLTTFGGRVGSDIIAAKQNLAAKLQEKALTDQISAAEMRIIQTKNKITSEDLQNESILRQINQQEVRRLFITGQITKAQYQQLMASNILGTNSKNILRTLAQGSLLFQNAGNWGARLGATIGLIGGGLKSIGKSLWGMIGGLPGLLITGLSMGVAYLWQQQEELSQAQKRAQEELSDRGKQMTEFLKDYNINDIIAKGSDAVDNAIEAYKDKLKELAPYNYDAYMMTANEKQSHEERLRYLSQQLELLKQANEEANKNSPKFVEDTKGSFEDALKDLRGKIKANGTFANTIADPISGLSVEGQYDSSLDKEMKNLAGKIAEALPNIGKDPKVTEAAKQLMSNMMAQLSFSPQEELYFKVKLGQLLHIPGSENALADEARTRLQNLIQTAKVTLSKGVTETGEQLSYKIRYGQKLSKAEENKLNELYDQALAQLKRDFPSYASELQTLLNNANFRANIRLNFIGGEAPSLYERQIMSHVPAMTNEKIRSKVSEWAALGSYEGNNKAKQEIDAAYNNMLADQDKVKKGKITQSVANTSKQEYNDLLTAANYFGYDYLGEKKKSNKPPKADHSAERAMEKAEREFMRARQKEENSIQSYYDTWDKWRKVEGDANARRRVANDPRFSKEFRSKYTDPEQLAANYEKLAKSIAQTTDERKQFVQELKSKAAEKEAQTEYENAQRLNNIFKEQLDNLSKRYELYQRLSKVAGSDAAGRFAFGPQQHSGSYYSYLMKRLQAIQKSNVKDFVENGGIAENVPDVKISANAAKVDFSKHGGLEGVLEMPDEDVLSEYGTNVSNLIKALKAERDKLDASIADSLEQGYSYFQDYGNEIDSINQKYNEQIERLKQRNALNKEDKDYLDSKSLAQQTTVLNQQRNRETAAANLKIFQNSDTYRHFFGNSMLLNTRNAEQYVHIIKDKLTEAFEKGGMSADDYAAKIKEANDTMDEVNNQRGELFTYMFGGGIDAVLKKQNDKGQQLFNTGTKDYEAYKRDYDQAEAIGDKEGMANAQSAMDEAKKMIQAGDSMMQGAKGAASTVAIIDKIVHGINDNVQKLKALIEDIANSIEVFSGKDHADNFRNSSGYAFISGFSSASQGATDAWDSLKSGNLMGVIEGGYRSIIGWAEPWARRHDAKLQKQIETAERTNKLIDSMRNSIERRLQNSLGGVYGYKGNDRDNKKIQDALDNYSLAKTGSKYGRNTAAQNAGIGIGVGALAGGATAVGLGALGGTLGGLGAGIGAGAAIGGAAGPIGAAIGAAVGAIIGGLFGHKRKKYKTNYTEDTYESMVKANQTQAYYDQMYASYKMQRDNLNAQLKAEEDKKGKDKDKINDYKGQLDELDDKIKTFAKDMAKSLYDIDVKSWAKELTDAVVSAWAAGEDAVDAYRDKVKDLMKTLATNIVTQKIMERAMQPVEDYIEKTMDAKSGKLDENDIVAIANMLDTIGNDTIPSITDFFEKLKDKGWDLSDTNSASMSSSIKGITENTADLLSSYINAIRADVSGIRQIESLYLPKLDITATAQLQQLTMITENTRRNADAAEQIRSSVIEVTSILTASRNGTRALTVKVE